ncbi:MAG: CaiB/BaiF CoA-transferase family protein [Pseudohongiellaceae bacterium]
MGPLHGIRVIEMGGIGPAPFCAMMLSDLGAEVIRIDRKQQAGNGDPRHVLNRGRRSLGLDLKHPDAVDIVMHLLDRADVLIEGFRPGVMERLGLGPDVCHQRNSGLIYGRMTGWGQSGPLAASAGHDLNYIALTGALHAMGDADHPPAPPLNLVGDFGGGGMYLVCGILAALLERNQSDRGQVIDAAMIDGAASLMAAFYGLKAMGRWRNERGSNMLDGGAHYYSCYTCKDGRFISVAAIEPRFYALLLKKCGIEDQDFNDQNGADNWPALKRKLARLFLTRTRDQWCELLEGSDACFAPVLDLDEAPDHPHNKERATFVTYQGVTQPAPAPRFSRSETTIQSPPARAGAHSREVLTDWGLTTDQVAKLEQAGVINRHP